MTCKQLIAFTILASTAYPSAAAATTAAAAAKPTATMPAVATTAAVAEPEDGLVLAERGLRFDKSKKFVTDGPYSKEPEPCDVGPQEPWRGQAEFLMRLLVIRHSLRHHVVTQSHHSDTLIGIPCPLLSYSITPQAEVFDQIKMPRVLASIIAGYTGEPCPLDYTTTKHYRDDQRKVELDGRIEHLVRDHNYLPSQDLFRYVHSASKTFGIPDGISAEEGMKKIKDDIQREIDAFMSLPWNQDKTGTEKLLQTLFSICFENLGGYYVIRPGKEAIIVPKLKDAITKHAANTTVQDLTEWVVGLRIFINTNPPPKDQEDASDCLLFFLRTILSDLPQTREKAVLIKGWLETLELSKELRRETPSSSAASTAAAAPVASTSPKTDNGQQ